MTTHSLYDQDFYSWAQQQAEALRAGRLSELDLENLAEEIESMGRSDRRALESHLRNVLMHLLKWKYQHWMRTPGWRQSIRNSRAAAAKRLKESPSLKAKLQDILQDEYPYARADAADETGLRLDDFPPACPWTLEQLLDEDFLPD